MSRRADWVDRAKYHLYRSVGQCTVAVMRDPQDAWQRLHVLRSCDGFKTYENLDPDRKVRSIHEAVNVAEKAAPESRIHPNAMRIEPVRRSDGAITEEIDVWTAGRGGTRRRRLAGAGRGRRKTACPANIGRKRAPARLRRKR